MKKLKLREYLEGKHSWEINSSCIGDKIVLRMPQGDIDEKMFEDFYLYIGEMLKRIASLRELEDDMISNLIIVGYTVRHAVRDKLPFINVTLKKKENKLVADMEATSYKFDFVEAVDIFKCVRKAYDGNLFKNMGFTFNPIILLEQGSLNGDTVNVDFSSLVRLNMSTPNTDLFYTIVQTNARSGATKGFAYKVLQKGTTVSLKITKDLFCGELALKPVAEVTKGVNTFDAMDLIDVYKLPNKEIDIERLKSTYKGCIDKQSKVRKISITINDPIVPRNTIGKILTSIGFKVHPILLDYNLNNGTIHSLCGIVTPYSSTFNADATIDFNDLLYGMAPRKIDKVATHEQLQTIKKILNSNEDLDGCVSHSDTMTDIMARSEYMSNIQGALEDASLEDSNTMGDMDGYAFDGPHYSEDEMIIEKENTANKEVIENQNKNNGGSKMKDMIKKMMGNLEFGEADSDEIRTTMAGGLAFNDGEGNWLSFDVVNKNLVNNLEFVMDFPGFKMPKLRNQLQVGELILINNGKDYGFITEVKPSTLKVLKKNGTVSTIKEVANIMGTQTFYTVVKSMYDFTGQAQNGMGFNPMMLAFMKDDDEEGDSSEMLKLIAMQGMFMNQAAMPANNGGMPQNPMANLMANPMMFATLMSNKKDGKKDSSMGDMMKTMVMSQLMQSGMFGQNMTMAAPIVQENVASVSPVVTEDKAEDPVNGKVEVKA